MIWKEQLLRLLEIIGGYPKFEAGLRPDLIIGLFCAVIACFAAYQAVAKACKCPAAESNRLVVALVIGIVLCLGTAAALNIYVVPKVDGKTLEIAIPIIGVIVVVLGVVAPISMLLVKGTYFQNLYAITLATLAAVVVVFMVKGAATAVRHGGKSFKAVKERNVEHGNSIDR